MAFYQAEPVLELIWLVLAISATVRPYQPESPVKSNPSPWVMGFASDSSTEGGATSVVMAEAAPPSGRNSHNN